MSTFGNKALIWWDYQTRDRAALLRFNATPKPLQLQILEKWYPIGMKVENTHQLTQDVTSQVIVPVDQPKVHHAREVADAIYTYLQRHGDILIVFIYFYFIAR